MQVELRDITTIKPYPGNPRRNDHAVEAVAASIKEFGFRQPLVVDEQGVLVVGSTRYKAALRLGLTTVPIHVARGLTPAQLRAYRIADNRTVEIADWDSDLLAAELAELKTREFDLDLLGFSTEELQQARAIGYLAGVARKAIETGNLAARLEILDRVLQQRNGATTP